MAATTTHAAKCQQHYTSNDGHNLTERSLPSEMTSSSPVAAYSTAGNEPENDGVTKKSDSGVYFAMMLSEYLDKKAMEEDQGDATTKPISSSDESNTTTTTTTTTTTVEPTATTVNSANDNVGRHGQHVPHGHQKDETYAEAQVKQVMANLPNLIWVPAHKHPQIAPSEFVNWIQVHGETPAMKQSKVRRQKSKLSRSISYDDANTLNNNENEKDSNTSASTTSFSSSSGEDSPTSPKDYELPQIQGKDVGFAFDRHPTEIDSSPILAPPTHHRTLLRRSAVSARRTASEGNADRRRSRRTQQQSRHAEDTSDRMGHVPTEAVNLHDHPVSMSEWIDLGNASLESSESQHGILSRVHDAESQLLKFMDDDDDDKKVAKATTMTTTIPEEPESDSSYPSATTKDDDTTTCTATTEPSTLDSKRMTLRRSASDLIPQKSEKKMSWIGALLNGDKKKRRSLRRTHNEKHKDQPSLQLTRVNSMGAVSTSTAGTKKRGLAAFISRSLSKSSSSGRKESKKTKKDPIPPPPSSTATSSVTTVASRHFIHSYRLPIHVERAIYRLSHMKLANPRRPLHQQVVISNFMFWYLSIINPQATQSTTTTTTTTNNTQWSQEGEEATSFRATSPPPPSSPSNNRFQKPSLNKRRASVSSNTGSSDEEDNVPLSFYRKGDV